MKQFYLIWLLWQLFVTKLHIIFSEKPPIIKDIVNEVPTVAHLPEYDIPQKRLKTDLQKYNQPDTKVVQRPDSQKMELPVSWEKLPTKSFEIQEDAIGLTMGSGSEPGITCKTL